jgi:ADP-heptose:LPS heptosyltransferase
MPGLGGFIAALAEASLFVSVPTGPMHLAAALKIPVVALYGPQDLAVDRTRFSPYGTRFEAVTSSVPCDCPGSRVCERAICMEGISEQAVLAAAERLLPPPV